MKMPDRKKIYAFASAVAVLMAALLFFAFNDDVDRKADNSSAGAPLDRFYQVKKGDLVIGILLSGTVNAQQKHKIALEAAFNTKLLWVIPENTNVKKGDSLAKFETEDLKIKIDELSLNAKNLEKQAEIAKEEIEILKSSNEAEIRASSDNLTAAVSAFSKYKKLEGPRDGDVMSIKVEDAKKAMEDAKKAYDDSSDDFSNTVFLKQSEEDDAKDKMKSLKNKADREGINYSNSILERKIFKRFTYPNSMTIFMNKVEQEKLNMNKTKIKTDSQLLQKESSMSQVEEQLKKVRRDLEKHQSYLPMMELTAPIDGIVTYGDPDNRRWGGQQELKIGMDVARKTVLLTIPDMSNMIVEFDLPEQYRSKVKQTDAVIITPDSIPELKVMGKVSKIALLPVNQIFWDRSSPKIYNSEVTLDEQNIKFVSGMSVQVEIISDTIKNILSVPVEAVFEENGKYFVYLKTKDKPIAAGVNLGQSNDNFVHIKSGLSEGDEVYLYRPFQSKTN